jgi:hypothetical protein
LRHAAAEGDVPEPSDVTPVRAQRIANVLSIAQLDEASRSTQCQTSADGVLLQPNEGDRFTFDFAKEPARGANFFMQSTAVAVLLGPGGQPIDSLFFKRDFGRTLEVTRDGLSLRLRSADARQPLVLCTAST